MKKLTNHHAGPRGINLEGGTTRWVDPGETISTDGKTIDGVKIVGDLPDFGKPREVAEDDAALTAAVEAENAELKAQVADLSKQVDALKAENDKLSKKA